MPHTFPFIRLALALLAILFLLQWPGCTAAPNPPEKLSAVGGWVPFRSFSYAGTDEALAQITHPQEQYLNPILPGFYPDPSICRVGDDYYLVNSSFWYFPGIPIWHSRNLVDWKQIGSVLDRPSQFATMKGGDVSRGIYAPTIRWHDGTFYVICTLVGGGGNFYVTAKDPAGPWSEPHFLPAVDGIDPSLFFDDDGAAYVVNCAGPPDGKALYDGHRTLRLRQLDLRTGQMTGREQILVNGGTDLARHPVWCEGPHLFKRNGEYYLIAAEGGTSTAHSEVVFRADALWGPYSPYAGNPILTQRRLPASRPDPITCAGHADFVATQNGDWWAVFLACQPYQGTLFNTGRETFLLPVTWDNDWPTILPDPAALVPRVVSRPKIAGGVAAGSSADTLATATGNRDPWSDSFTAPRLDFRWNQLRAPSAQWYALDPARGLLIEPRPVPLTGTGNPSLICCRQRQAHFTAVTRIQLQPATLAAAAGIVAFQNESHFFFLGVRAAAGTAGEVFLEQMNGPARPASGAAPLAQMTLPAGITQIDLKIVGAARNYSFYYRTGDAPADAPFKPLRENVDGSMLSTDIAGGFQGVMLGMFARPGA